jgi:RimJ/RimL family protein N-acetyltransferase
MIRGEKTILRSLESTDVELLHGWMNDPEVTRWLGRRLPMSLSEVRQWVEEPVDRSRDFRLGITDLEGKLVGWCDLSRWDSLQDNAALTIAIGDKSCWGGGYGTDATLTLCGYGFAQLNLHRIGLFVFAPHAAAIHIYEKCGFRHEGRMIESGFRHGARHDLLMMGLLREEFKAKWPERWSSFLVS